MSSYESIPSLNSLELNNKVVKRFQYDTINWCTAYPIIETLIELPDVVHFIVDQEDIISMTKEQPYPLFRVLYRLETKREENDDLIEEWRIRTKVLRGKKLKYIIECLANIYNDYYRMDRPPIRNKLNYINSNELKAYSSLNGDGQLIVRMRPRIQWKNRVLTVCGSVKDMFGINGSNQWFLSDISYKIGSIEVGNFIDHNGKRLLSKMNIVDRAFMHDISVYSTKIRNEETYPIKNQNCTIFNDDFTKSISVQLNSFQDGGNYDGSWSSLIRRHISRLNLYQLHKVPVNATVPLIIPFQWQVPLKGNEHLISAKISIKMTAHRLITKENLTHINYLTTGVYKTQTQVSQFDFNLVPLQDLQFHLESVERRTTNIPFNIS